MKNQLANVHDLILRERRRYGDCRHPRERDSGGGGGWSGSLGNSDAHGKNYAILFAKLVTPHLAPLYDIVCTAAYDLDEEMAMPIGDAVEPAAVTRMDWVDMSSDCDLRVEPFLEIVRETAVRVRDCAEGVAGLARAEGRHAPVIDQVVEVARRRSALVLAQID